MMGEELYYACFHKHLMVRYACVHKGLLPIMTPLPRLAFIPLCFRKKKRTFKIVIGTQKNTQLAYIQSQMHEQEHLVIYRWNNTTQNLAKEKSHMQLWQKTKPKEGVDSTCREDV